MDTSGDCKNESPEFVSSTTDDICDSKRSHSSSEVSPHVQVRPGEAAIKPQYLLPVNSFREIKCTKKNPIATDEMKKKSSVEENDHNDEPPKKKREKGMNKKRPRQPRPEANDKICRKFIENENCPFGKNCSYSHNLENFIANRMPDIGDACVNFRVFGKCPYGVSCRFGKEHLTNDFKNIIKENSKGSYSEIVKNNLTKELQVKLRKKKTMFPRSDEYLQKMKALISQKRSLDELNNCQRTGSITDEEIVKPRKVEKKVIEFSEKLYLAPLTTVGNLPFRRICKDLGADITCGEMAMCTNLLQGHQSEWALVKRHSCEDIFGIQLCGSFPDTMSKCAELLQSTTEIDFMDINVGCPIDLVFNKGAGSALMDRVKRFEEIVRGMKYVLDMPLTVKMRTGVHDKNWNAYTLIPKLRDWGVSLVTLHGRSREQRYTKSADWNYINQCARVASPLPLFEGKA